MADKEIVDLLELLRNQPEEVTPHAGVAMLVELVRRSGVMAAAAKCLPPKKSAKGLGQDQMVESFVLLSALGGDCMDDFDGLRRDYGLRAVAGYRLPSEPTARQWLDRFHEEALVAARPQRGSFIPPESRWLAGLRAAIVDLPRAAWQFWTVEPGGFVREWAEVPYVPTRVPERRDSQPYHYLAIRIRTPQGVLFGDGTTVKHFAVVTNDWEEKGQRRLEWRWGKAGTVEQVRRVLKDELVAGVYPSGCFGANAAWLRLQVLTFNLLGLLKAAALEPQYRNAGLKRLWFAILTQFGRVVRHARRQLVRLATRARQAVVVPGHRRLAVPAWPAP